MLTIAVCDDDFYFANKLEKTLHILMCDKVSRIDVFINPEKLLKSDIVYDYIFLDIDMPQLNGIEVAKRFNSDETSVVFVSNKESYVFDAYNSTDAFGFIRKSHLKEDLESIFSRLNKNINKKAVLRLKSGSNVIKIKYSNIIYLEKLVNNVVIHTIDGDYTERNSLTSLESEFLGRGFVRAHVGYIVNLEYIKTIDSNEITLQNLKKIPMSRKNSKLVKEAFLEWSVEQSD